MLTARQKKSDGEGRQVGIWEEKRNFSRTIRYKITEEKVQKNSRK